MAAWDGAHAWLWAGPARSSRVRGSPTSLEAPLSRPHHDLGPGCECLSRGAKHAEGLKSGQSVSVTSSQDCLSLEDV